MIDYAAAWTELAAWIAEESNRGRQPTLVKMAELCAKHTVPEDDLERALRLVHPRVMEVLFNRVPLLMAAATQASGAGSPEPHEAAGSEADSPSIAVPA